MLRLGPLWSKEGTAVVSVELEALGKKVGKETLSRVQIRHWQTEVQQDEDKEREVRAKCTLPAYAETAATAQPTEYTRRGHRTGNWAVLACGVMARLGWLGGRAIYQDDS
ncbi:hypothetical protein HBI56_071370 [Parastagonospora nodorum]|uniref:Uncharacterized protein n=1 Tax=Phaeosphaeria nodorum (strain SN15 / ATCC MYA-4574 / FGSC 10173) TaxID=321614 RepID=A0A7U2HTQ8_PHANO|nr:hypothetical protein HBH56_005820 [Parastagonospora nodorum]QRC90448.1 hypothetical protein JI435_425380 [Parastagonospora nodorum SN15]KAH3937806.1 hypothetical protein HBH54_005810 [Parastagonospora nodorum]KAH3946725.1 hypothetical protein HBH53_126160 [Parastagonospora nodorum]KAH3975196.1 hypothetical protein HBH51_088540 [Parastagonospora nodorum]